MLKHLGRLCIGTPVLLTLAIACLLVTAGCSDEQIRAEARRAWIAMTLARPSEKGN